jgi:hypothetical protein
LRVNAAGFSVAAGISLLNGINAGMNRIAWGVATGDATNPNTDPNIALQQLQYLRNQINAPRGPGYALWHGVCGTWRDEVQKQYEALGWIDEAEQYWEDRRDADIRAQLPAPGVFAVPQPEE